MQWLEFRWLEIIILRYFIIIIEFICISWSENQDDRSEEPHWLGADSEGLTGETAAAGKCRRDHTHLDPDSSESGAAAVAREQLSKLGDSKWVWEE